MASSEAASGAGACISNPFAPLANQQQHEHPPPPPAKKKRNLPGTPDPEAEVIALSPRTLMATNRFVCEICGKGFQRDQNLQLHRRGHNLPWKLRQRSGKEPRKRVYVCPEKSCVHHNPARALGDLTGIKKHFCRKHGEKKWKCDKCSKRYAVQSDWKAHSKTCGTREYRCDCGTLFSRRDSFITHRAFCDALAEETARMNAAAASGGVAAACGQGGYLIPAARPGMVMMPPGGGGGEQMKAMGQNQMMLGDVCGGHVGGGGLSLWGGAEGLPLPLQLPSMGGHIANGVVPPQLYADLFAAAGSGAPPPPQFDAAQLSWLYGNGKMASSNASELTSAATAAKEADSLFSNQQHAKPASSAPTDMSATALLQKAAQIGAVTSAAAMPQMSPFEHTAKSGGGGATASPASADECGIKFDGGAALFAASQLHNASLGVGGAMGELAGNVHYDVLSAVRHAGLKDGGGGGVGREETRDFLGVGVQALCSPSIHGWI
uniref:Protein EARLY HEADING DATE 2 n=1 Tax=Leersia perrieri TaxID=77586 RepID=A0A0D9UYW2_9ORYZ